LPATIADLSETVVEQIDADESQDDSGPNWHKQSASFLVVGSNYVDVVAMGVLDRAKQVSGISTDEEESFPYVCLACETVFEVQHHSCPACGSFDVRRSEWVQE
jgi:rRNA maturation endonuclease Nob1